MTAAWSALSRGLFVGRSPAVHLAVALPCHGRSVHAVHPPETHGPAVPRVLLVAPEGGRASVIESLRHHGLAVLVAPDGALVEQVESGAVDLVLLQTGASRAHDELTRLRAVSEVPVVVALREARAAHDAFFEIGADDCVGAAATRTELAARVHAVLRRRQRPTSGEVLRSGDFVMDLARHVFHHQGRAVHLPPKEFGLLELLLRRDGRVVGREEALELVWGHRADVPNRGGDPTTVDVHIKRMRAKVEVDPANPKHLLTVRGLGYRFEA